MNCFSTSDLRCVINVDDAADAIERARQSGGNVDVTPCNTVALAQLLSRLDRLRGQRDKLNRMVEQLETTIANVRERTAN